MATHAVLLISLRSKRFRGLFRGLFRTFKAFSALWKNASNVQKSLRKHLLRRLQMANCMRKIIFRTYQTDSLSQLHRFVLPNLSNNARYLIQQMYVNWCYNTGMNINCHFGTETDVYLTIILRGRAGYRMIDNQRGA